MPSTTRSSTPVRVSVCAVLQFAGVNVTLTGDTVPSVSSSEIRPIVTSAVGWVFSTIVNWSMPPCSVVVRPDVGLTVIPTAGPVLTPSTLTSSTFQPEYPHAPNATSYPQRRYTVDWPSA